MYSILNQTDSYSSTRSFRFPKVDYIRNKLYGAHHDISNHYRSRMASINSFHIMVLLSKHLLSSYNSTDIPLDSPEIKFFLKDFCNEASTLFGCFSKYKEGRLVTNAFYKDCEEFIYLDYNAITDIPLKEKWYEVDTVIIEAHASKDLSMNTLGPNKDGGHGIVSVNINVYNLLVSLVKFYSMNKKLENPYTMNQYVSGYLLPNGTLTNIDVSFLNYWFGEEPKASDIVYENVVGAVTTDYINYIDETISSIIRKLNEPNVRLSLEDLMDLFPLLSSDSLREFFSSKRKLNNKISYIKFWYRNHRLISLLVRYTANQGDNGKYNIHLNELRRLIGRSKSMEVFNDHDSLEEYIDTQISPFI